MKKIILSIIIAIFAFGSATKVTTIERKSTKDSVIFVYDVPDKNFEELKAQPDFYKNLLIKMVCNNPNAKFVVSTMNIIYDYRKHSNHNDKVVIKIKKGSCTNN